MSIEKKKSESLDYYQIEKTIGEGTFGKVKLGYHIPTGEKVSIKILEKDKIQDKEDLKRISREIKIIKLLNHPNIIKIYQIIEDSKNYYIIMEYAKGGELFDYIVRKKYLSEKESSILFYQLISAIEFIHKNKISHRDIKPENILLKNNLILSLIDFGLSIQYYDNQLLNTPCGSPCYAAPEMIMGKKYNGLFADLWSCGIVLYAMVCGYLPFEDKDNEKLYRKIINGKLNFPDRISFKCKDLIKKILCVNVKKRLNVLDIKNHPFLEFGKNFYQKEFKNFLLFGNHLKISNINKDIVLKIIHDFDVKNSYDEIVDMISQNKHNSITTTYFLMIKKFGFNGFGNEIMLSFDKKNFQKLEKKIINDDEKVIEPESDNDNNNINENNDTNNDNNKVNDDDDVNRNIVNNINCISERNKRENKKNMDNNIKEIIKTDFNDKINDEESKKDNKSEITINDIKSEKEDNLSNNNNEKSEISLINKNIEKSEINLSHNHIESLEIHLNNKNNEKSDYNLSHNINENSLSHNNLSQNFIEKSENSLSHNFNNISSNNLEINDKEEIISNDLEIKDDILSENNNKEEILSENKIDNKEYNTSNCNIEKEKLNITNNNENEEKENKNIENIKNKNIEKIKNKIENIKNKNIEKFSKKEINKFQKIKSHHKTKKIKEKLQKIKKEKYSEQEKRVQTPLIKINHTESNKPLLKLEKNSETNLPTLDLEKIIKLNGQYEKDINIKYGFLDNNQRLSKTLKYKKIKKPLIQNKRIKSVSYEEKEKINKIGNNLNNNNDNNNKGEIIDTSITFDNSNDFFHYIKKNKNNKNIYINNYNINNINIINKQVFIPSNTINLEPENKLKYKRKISQNSSFSNNKSKEFSKSRISPFKYITEGKNKKKGKILSYSHKKEINKRPLLLKNIYSDNNILKKSFSKDSTINNSQRKTERSINSKRDDNIINSNNNSIRYSSTNITKRTKFSHLFQPKIVDIDISKKNFNKKNQLFEKKNSKQKFHNSIKTVDVSISKNKFINIPKGYVDLNSRNNRNNNKENCSYKINNKQLNSGFHKIKNSSKRIITEKKKEKNINNNNNTNNNNINNNNNNTNNDNTSNNNLKNTNNNKRIEQKIDIPLIGLSVEANNSFALCTSTLSYDLIVKQLNILCKENQFHFKRIEKSNNNKFNCTKGNNVAVIEISKGGKHNILKLYHMNGKEEITKDLIKKIIVNIGF